MAICMICTGVLAGLATYSEPHVLLFLSDARTFSYLVHILHSIYFPRALRLSETPYISPFHTLVVTI